MHPPAERAPQTGRWAAIVRWFRAFVDEPESYHSPKAGVTLPPHPASRSILAQSPTNDGWAGLVTLAACP
jgi:hypothetical protein